MESHHRRPSDAGCGGLGGVISQIIFGCRIWFTLEEFGKLSEHTDVGFLSSLAFSAMLQVLLNSASELRRLEIDVEKQSLAEEPLRFKDIDSAQLFAERSLASANEVESITELPLAAYLNNPIHPSSRTGVPMARLLRELGDR